MEVAQLVEQSLTYHQNAHPLTLPQCLVLYLLRDPSLELDIFSPRFHHNQLFLENWELNQSCPLLTKQWGCPASCKHINKDTLYVLRSTNSLSTSISFGNKHSDISMQACSVWHYLWTWLYHLHIITQLAVGDIKKMTCISPSILMNGKFQQ